MRGKKKKGLFSSQSKVVYVGMLGETHLIKSVYVSLPRIFLIKAFMFMSFLMEAMSTVFAQFVSKQY